MLMKSIEHMFQAASACCSHKSEALSQTVFRRLAAETDENRQNKRLRQRTRTFP